MNQSEKTSNFKAVIMDLDGTTVASAPDALPSRRVIDAVQKAQEKVHVGLVTGRELRTSQPIIDALGLRGPSVFSGGSRIVDLSTGEDLVRQELAPEVLRQLVRAVSPTQYQLNLVGADFRVQISSPEQVETRAVMLIIHGVTKEDGETLQKGLERVKGTVAHLANSWEGKDVFDIHITHEQASKAHGAERMIELLGLKKEEVMAIGDNHNDLPLLQMAGFKVAMGNGEQELKDAADHVAPSLDDDGVADTIERFILAEPKKQV